MSGPNDLGWEQYEDQDGRFYEFGFNEHETEYGYHRTIYDRDGHRASWDTDPYGDYLGGYHEDGGQGHSFGGG